MLAACAFVLICTTALSLSAPLDCENLLRPLDQLDPQYFTGRWALVAATVRPLPLLERLRQRDSYTASFSNNTAETTLSRSKSEANKCTSKSHNISLAGSTFTFDNGSVTTTFVRTSCHDCILLSSDVESGKRLHVYFFSRRRQLEEKEMEEFRAQVACLNLPPAVVMDPTKELCPEQTGSSSVPVAQTDGEKAANH